MISNIRELDVVELQAVNGGCFWLGVLAGVLGNEITRAIDSDGPVKGGVLEGFVKFGSQLGK